MSPLLLLIAIPRILNLDWRLATRAAHASANSPAKGVPSARREKTPVEDGTMLPGPIGTFNARSGVADDQRTDTPLVGLSGPISERVVRACADLRQASLKADDLATRRALAKLNVLKDDASLNLISRSAAWNEWEFGTMQQATIELTPTSMAAIADTVEFRGYSTPETRTLYPFAALLMGVRSRSLDEQVAAHYRSLGGSSYIGVDLTGDPHDDALFMAAVSVVREYESLNRRLTGRVLDLMLSWNPRNRFALLHRGFLMQTQGRFHDALASFDRYVALSEDREERSYGQSMRDSCERMRRRSLLEAKS